MSLIGCLLHTRFRTFYLIYGKYPNPSQNFYYSQSLNFHISGSPEYVSKQPTQLIVELNLSMWHIIVTLVQLLTQWAEHHFWSGFYHV